jgi:Ni,Fe-hydrogenase maturation factor
MTEEYLYAKDISAHAIKVIEMLDALATYQKIEVLVVAQQLLALEERRAMAIVEAKARATNNVT